MVYGIQLRDGGWKSRVAFENYGWRRLVEDDIKDRDDNDD